MNICKKGTMVSFIVCFMFLTISGCTKPHEHQWSQATCTEPEICSICGKTNGEPLGHKPGEPERFDHDDGYAVLTHCTVCGKVASKDFVSMYKDDSILGATTIGEFIDNYNEFVKENNKLDEKLAYLQPVHFDNIKQTGANGDLKLSDNISISLTYCGKYSTNSHIYDIKLVGSLTGNNGNEVASCLEAILYGIDNSLFTEHFEEISDYIKGITGPPDIYGYSFLDLSDNNNLLFLIKYD